MHLSLNSLIRTNSLIWTLLTLKWHRGVRIIEVLLYLGISRSTPGEIKKYLCKVQVLLNEHLKVLKYKYSCTWAHAWHTDTYTHTYTHKHTRTYTHKHTHIHYNDLPCFLVIGVRILMGTIPSFSTSSQVSVTVQTIQSVPVLSSTFIWQPLHNVRWPSFPDPSYGSVVSYMIVWWDKQKYSISCCLIFILNNTVHHYHASPP